MSDEEPGSAEIHVPAGRDRLGSAHQLRVDISIAISLAPAWLRRALGDRDVAKARGARIDFVERIAAAIERRFHVTWVGSTDSGENARPPECASPLFGGPETARNPIMDAVDHGDRSEHK
jgi:hypothetical protein